MSWLDDRVRDLLWANHLRSEVSQYSERSGADIWVLARAALPGLRHIPLDNSYWLCSHMQLLRFIGDRYKSHWDYLAERYDCEDYAIAFRSMCVQWFGCNGVGIVIDEGPPAHSYNLIVFSDRDPAIFEPQTDSWPEVGQGLYQAQKGLLLF